MSILLRYCYTASKTAVNLYRKSVKKFKKRVENDYLLCYNKQCIYHHAPSVGLLCPYTVIFFADGQHFTFRESIMAEEVKAWQDWRIVKKLGEGGFGTVYEIMRDSFSIEEHRALKVIRIPADENDVKRVMSEGMDEANTKAYYRSLVNEFVKEIAFLSKLRGSAHIVTYDDYRVIEKKDGVGWDIFIMMELLTPLPDLLDKEPLSESEVRKLGEHISDALSVCHRKNILHRDIKADNIFVSQDGSYKLGDFGIARTVEKTSAAHTRIGTSTYMAPEAYRGQEYDSRADIYSLGILLYRLLNDNRVPFLPPYPAPVNVQDRDDALTRRFSGEPLPPPAHGIDGIKAIVLKACAFKPEDRFSSAEELKAALSGSAEYRHVQPPVIVAPVYDDNATRRADATQFAPAQPQRQAYPRQEPLRQPQQPLSRPAAPQRRAAAPPRPAVQRPSQPPRGAQRRGYYDTQEDVRPSGINAGVAVVIILIVLVLIGGGVTIFALLNRNAVDKIKVEEDTRYVETIAPTEAPPAEADVITPKKTFTYTIQVNHNFKNAVPIQLFVDGETNTDEIKYITQSGEYTFTTEVTKDADVIVTIDGVEYYTCKLIYDSGIVTQESYNTAFYSQNIA